MRKYGDGANIEDIAKLKPGTPEAEAIANAYLRKHKACDGEYPAYPESDFTSRDLKHSGERSLEEVFNATVGKLKGIDDLFDVYWPEIRAGGKYVGLEEWQLDIVEYRMNGNKIKEIAEIMDCSERTVYYVLKKSSSRIQRIPAFGLWSVIAEVFDMSIYTVMDITRKRARK